MPDFFLFRCASQNFALPADAVLSVAEAGPAQALPLTPDYVEGVTGVFDRIAPQQALAARLGLPCDKDRENALILIDDGAGAMALRVEAVERTVSSRLTPCSTHTSAEADDICGGELSVGRSTYRLIRPEALRFTHTVPVGLNLQEPSDYEKPAAVAAPVLKSEAMVVLTCGPRRFAVPDGQVERVAVLPSVIHPVSAPKPILGRSRDDGALVVSLAGALGIDEVDAPQIMIVTLSGNKEIAFTADATTGLQECQIAPSDDESVVDPEGHRAERLDLTALVDRFARPSDDSRAPALPLAKRKDTKVSGRTRLMTVRVNESWYGLSADLVRGVGVPTGFAALYGEGHRFDGIAVLGGDAVPAIDLHRVFQAPRRNSGIATVMAMRDGTVALLSDAVGQIEEIQTDRIEESSEPFIAGRISRSTQTIHMVDLRRVVQMERAA